MSIGKVEEARGVLIMYSKLAKQTIDLSNVHLTVGESASKEEKMSTRYRVSKYRSNWKEKQKPTLLFNARQNLLILVIINFQGNMLVLAILVRKYYFIC
jgi:mannosyltransferase OCH1-like enzyme